jgi:hypothetical protein
MAGHGADIAALVERGAGGDEAAGLGRRLDHDDGAGEARDDPVAGGEMAGLRFEPDGLFGQQQAPGGDVGGKGGVFGRVDHVDAAGHRGDGAGGQGGGMGGGVDAARQARDDDEARLTEIGGERAGHAQAERGGVAGAHEGDHRPGKEVGPAAEPQERRRIGDVGQGCGVVGRAVADKPGPGARAGGKFGAHDAFGAGVVALQAGGACHIGQGRKRGAGGAVVGDQTPEGGDADAAGAQQAEPVQQIVFRAGWEWGVSGRGSFHGHPDPACCRVSRRA